MLADGIRTTTGRVRRTGYGRPVSRRVRIAAALGVVACCVAAGSVAANPEVPGPPPVVRAGVPSEIVITELGAGTGVDGSIGAVGSTSDPSVAYPPDTTGFTPLNEGFAGAIVAQPPAGPPPTLSMYCIDIRTPTNIGYGYNLGTWGEAAVTNPGYVARILNEYYPNVPDLPAIGSSGIANVNDQAAAVQAAIWYFSDNYVVAATDAKFPAVAAIVNAVRVQPPLPPPTPPTISIVPSSSTGDAGSVVGPLTVDANVAGLDITVTATGGDLFLDAAGSVPVTGPVEPGTDIWVRRATVGDVAVVASAEVTVPSGAAWLYSGNVEGVDAAQKLILAETIVLDASAQAGVVFQQPTTTTSTSTTTTSTTTTTTAPTTTTTATSTTTSTSTSSTSTSSSTTSTSTPAATTTTVARGGSGGRLPGTGSDTGPVLAVAGLVALVGAAIVVATRRRPSARP